MERPAVTLMIPVYNGARTLGRVLRAVADQSVAPERVVVVDDGSTDDSAAIARVGGVAGVAGRGGVEVVSHGRNLGLGAARTTALALCDTPLLAGLDADVAPGPRWLEHLVDALERDPGAAGAATRLHEPGRGNLAARFRAAHLVQGHGDAPVSDAGWLPGANFLYRTSAIRRVGGWDPARRTNAEDWDLGRRLAAAGLRCAWAPADRESECTHLRRDNPAEVLDVYYRHHFFGHREPVGLGAAVRSAVTGVRTALSLARRDLVHRPLLVPLDLALGPYTALRDLQAAVTGPAPWYDRGDRGRTRS